MYKVVYDGKVLDVLTDSVKYIKYLTKSNHISLTDKTSADGFYGSDNRTIYLMEGKLCPPDKNWKSCKLQKITVSEYRRLAIQLKKTEVEADVQKLATARRDKIVELSNLCNQAITDGVSVLFSDNLYHKFRLTTEDQLNLLLLEKQVAANVKLILYHETNQLSKWYKQVDVKKLLQAADKHKTYHQNYFNILKYCINNMYNIEEINSIQYGSNIDTLNISDDCKLMLKENRLV